jgi:phage gpG-like protein
VGENVQISIDTTEWDEFLRGLVNGLKSTAPYLQAAYMTLGFKNIIEHFEREEGPDGSWPRRAASTQEMYAAIESGRRKPPKGGRAGSYSPSNKILQLTGRTRGSILPGGNNVRQAGPHAVMVLAGTEYSGPLDEGTGRMPARPFMWLSPDTQDDIGGMVLDLLIREKGGA